MTSTGPSIKAVCRVLNQNSCGSGSICGVDGDEGLVLTNAHVAGTRIGRRVTVEVEAENRKRYEGRVVRAAYSNSVSADWALLRVPGLVNVPPVYLSREPIQQGESLYTKGFPRCKPHNGTDIKPVYFGSHGIVMWLPNSISGQSGSGVWSDKTNLQQALLTWSMSRGRRWYGAGQMTSEIYRQNRDFKLTGMLRGAPRLPGWEYRELTAAFDVDWDTDGLDDPEVTEGFDSEPFEMGIQDEPIWAHLFDDPEPEPDPGNDPKPPQYNAFLKSLYGIQDLVEKEIAIWEVPRSEKVPGTDEEEDNLFGL